MATGIDNLLQAIAYPEGEVPANSREAQLRVDGGIVDVREENGRLIFSRRLLNVEEDAEAFLRLTGYAAGRILREDAVLAVDPRANALILWQDVPANVQSTMLKRVFEVFCTSCDWWLSRVDENQRAQTAMPQMVIMP